MSGGRLPLTLIAAVARNGVIGSHNRMPWRLPGDMAHFRAATQGRPVLIGRKTFESIGRPLPGRPVVVASRTLDGSRADVDVVPDLDSAWAVADRRGRALGSPEIMVAGGGAVYQALIGAASCLLLTLVDVEPPGDTQFPPIDPSLWQEAERIPVLRQADDDASYTFVRYRRA